MAEPVVVKQEVVEDLKHEQSEQAQSEMMSISFSTMDANTTETLNVNEFSRSVVSQALSKIDNEQSVKDQT